MQLNAESRVLVLAVHPDDETLGAGGLIQRARSMGAALRVVFVTAGDNNPWPQRLLEFRLRIGPAQRESWAVRRRGEALAALEAMGVPPGDAFFLNYPDQALTSLLLTRPRAWLRELTDAIESFGPTIVVAPSARDSHPDHNALAVAVELIRKRRNASWRVMQYLIHSTRDDGTFDARYESLELSAAEIENRRRALWRHASQMKLSSRRFLKLLHATEVYEVMPDAAAAGANGAPGPISRAHPVKFLGQDNDVYRVRVPAASARRAGKLLLAGVGACGSRSLDVDLRDAAEIKGRGTITLAVRDTSTSDEAGTAKLKRAESGWELAIPQELLTNSKGLHAKLQRPVLFFDRAGWVELPAPMKSSHEYISPAEARQRAATHAATRLQRNTETPPRVVAVIPCYNVEKLCEPVIRETLKVVDHVIAVDDGSTDGTGALLARLEREAATTGGAELIVMPFKVNRGKGVALIEGFRRALEMPFDYVVTLDSDGQHRPADIGALVQTAHWAHAELVIGSRLETEAMPLRSRIGNRATARITQFFFPDCPEDTQSGLRVHGRRFTHEIVRTFKGHRYETEMRILLLALRHNYTVRMVQIPTIYRDGNQSSHFRPLADSLRILWILVISVLHR